MRNTCVGARIAKLRIQKNLTQLELAETLGVTDRAVSKWETGGAYPDVELLVKIAEVLSTSIDYLLRGELITKQAFFADYVNTGFNERINKAYLQDGWRIVDMKLSGDGEGACLCAILFEKDFGDT